MKLRWTRWIDTVFRIDALILGIPLVLAMLLAIWLMWRAFGSW